MKRRQTRPLYLCLVLILFLGSRAQAQSPRELLAEGDRLLALDSLGAARRAFARAAQDPAAAAVARIGIGRVLMAQKQLTPAGDAFDEALKLQPDNIEAHFYKGIVQRELAKFRTINQSHHWSEARKEFDWVLRTDSTFGDILYQYALLHRYLDNYEQAVDFATRQVKLKPGSIAARHDLFRIYHSYINHTPDREAMAWLSARNTQISDYFVGELHRKYGRLEAADSIFVRLLTEALTMPRTPVLLSRARVLYAKGQVEQAQVMVDQAIKQIRDGLDASFLFDDAKYLMTDVELATWKRVVSPEAYREFFTRFWDKRDPSPARPINVRLAEHYRRLLVAEKDYLFDGVRLWHTNPDQFGDFVLPRSYDLNQEFNDKGLIYIRQGEPSDRVTYVGSQDDFMSRFDREDIYYMPAAESGQSEWLPNESWRYNDPKMDFHFVVAGGGGANNWRLTPRVTMFGWIEQLETWGSPYAELSYAVRTLRSVQELKNVDVAFTNVPMQRDSTESQILVENEYMLPRYNQFINQFQETQRRVIEQSKEAATLALTTDRHTWQKEVKPIEMPSVVSTFRGKEGKTRVEVHYALPAGRLSKALNAAAGNMDIEVGFSVQDTSWNIIGAANETKKVPVTPDESVAMIDYFDATVPADTYVVAIYGRPKQGLFEGGQKLNMRLRDYSGPGLQVSDLLLADFIGPARGSRFDRGEVHVSPNPFQRFSTRQPVFVYFEVYGLRPGEDGQTRWNVEYSLIPDRSGRLTVPLVGGGEKPSLTLRMQRGGSETSPQEYSEIDVSSVQPGNYILQVTITDELGASMQIRTRPLELYLYKK